MTTHIRPDDDRPPWSVDLSVAVERAGPLSAVYVLRDPRGNETVDVAAAGDDIAVLPGAK